MWSTMKLGDKIKISFEATIDRMNANSIGIDTDAILIGWDNWLIVNPAHADIEVLKPKLSELPVGSMLKSRDTLFVKLDDYFLSVATKTEYPIDFMQRHDFEIVFNPKDAT